MAVDLNTSAERTPAEAEPTSQKFARAQVLLRDDRWPDRLATAMFAFAVLVVVAAFIPPLRRYFLQWHDIVSMLTIPIVPNLVYAALLISVGVALRRRLRTAWWIFVIWWIILPQLGRIFSIISGGPLLPQIAGLVIMSFVLVILWRARPQFQARGSRRNLFAAIICFLLGSCDLDPRYLADHHVRHNMSVHCSPQVRKCGEGAYRADEVGPLCGSRSFRRGGCGGHPYVTYCFQAASRHPHSQRCR